MRTSKYVRPNLNAAQLQSWLTKGQRKVYECWEAAESMAHGARLVGMSQSSWYRNVRNIIKTVQRIRTGAPLCRVHGCDQVVVAKKRCRQHFEEFQATRQAGVAGLRHNGDA
jgi:hypothetical protein